MKGKIIKLLSGVYTVVTSEGNIQCTAKGGFRKLGISPVPGDYVEISVFSDGSGRIEKILPRSNYLIRPNVSNVDALCYVSSYAKPTPYQYTIDKMLVISKSVGVEPILIFNKADLDDEDDVQVLVDLYKSIGYAVFCVSAETGAGVEDLRAALAGKTVIFAGNTGVGKSSIINKLFPELNLKTGEISDKLGRGRHTTRHIELFSMGDGYLADTPGFGALELEGYSIETSELEGYFPEFSPFLSDCCYLNCAHMNEKECGVRTAVENGAISSSRYESYRQMYQKLKESETPWSKKKSN